MKKIIEIFLAWLKQQVLILKVELSVLAPMQQYLKDRIPDYQYAGRSLLPGDLEGSKRLQKQICFKAVGADVPDEGVDVPRQFYSSKGGLSPVASETDTGYYLQDGTFVPYQG